MDTRIENSVMVNDDALEAVSGGLQQGGEWKHGARGNWSYSGWATEGSKKETYTGSNRREYTNDGHINLWSFDGSSEHLKAKLKGSF